MPRVLIAYVRIIDAVNYRLGRLIMYGLFVMVGVLMWSSISKTFLQPSPWTLEVAQFALVAYYLFGGPYSIQMAANVRMDLFYGSWTRRQKAGMDMITVWFLIFYLGVMIYGAVGSTAYSLGYFGDQPFVFFRDLLHTLITDGVDGARDKLGFIERSPTAWRPYLWPVKVIATIGLFLMLLQAISEFIKDVATLRGIDLHKDAPAHRRHEEDIYKEHA